MFVESRILNLRFPIILETIFRKLSTEFPEGTDVS